MNKIPKVFNKKWKRYSKIEKLFLLFLFVLLWVEVFLPFIKISSVEYSMINSKFLLTSVILLFTLIFLIAWNSSYTIKWFVKSVFGFEQNDAILNFWVFFLHASILIYTKEYIYLLWKTLSSEYYSISYGYYIIWWFLIVWMIWNLFIAINNSINYKTKKNNYTKIIWNPVVEEENNEKKEIKTLF